MIRKDDHGDTSAPVFPCPADIRESGTVQKVLLLCVLDVASNVLPLAPLYPVHRRPGRRGRLVHELICKHLDWCPPSFSKACTFARFIIVATVLRMCIAI